MFRPVHVALIEPNPADARWFDLTLDEVGVHHRITRFHSCIDAVRSLGCGTHRTVFDLILISSELPMLSPTEVIDEIRREPALQHTPVAVVSDHIGGELIVEGDYKLDKPVDAYQVKRMLRHFRLTVSDQSS